MVRSGFLALGAALLVTLFSPSGGTAQEELDPGKKERQALLDFLKQRGVELRPVEGTPGSYIQMRFTVGPAFERKHVVGLNYLPPLTVEKAKEKYIGFSLPYEFHGNWAVFRLGGPTGNATPEYVADWNKVVDGLRAFADPANRPGK